MSENNRSIGDIGNYCGGVQVNSENGKFYWAVFDGDGMFWEEITEDLFNALNKHEDDRTDLRKCLTEVNE